MPPPSSSSLTRSVTIHVFDEHHKRRKDFQCQRGLLLAKMKYFQTYLNEANEQDEIDISVHCDVETFEMLMVYMHQHDQEQQLCITLENIASILVSSEFLQMEELVEECVDFISGHVQDFMLLRVDFGYLSDAIIAKIASKCTPEQLLTLHDPKDKILSKLWQKKVGALVTSLQHDRRKIELCTNCELLFVRSVGCRKGKRQIGKHGELVGKHQAKSGWHMEAFFRELRIDKQISWRAVYWYISGATEFFVCSVCKQRCSLLELQDCAYHPGPIVNYGHSAKYSCCSAQIFSADEILMRGCETTIHVPLQSDKRAEVRSFCNAVSLENMWDQIHACTKVARAQGTPFTGNSGGGGVVDVASLFPPRVKNVEHELVAKKLNTVAEGSSSGYRKLCKALQLQETDRVRCQNMARQLLLHRKKATS